MWVFGYGSLVWKPGFEFVESVHGFVKGYSRRFWQSSPDHRGTPAKPGRTVTLVADPEGQVWGMAYRIAGDKAAATTAYLDHREKAGYEAAEVEFHPDEAGRVPFPLTVYVSPPSADNVHWVGSHETEEMIAETVVSCTGPSGTNIEYVVRLAEAQRRLAPGVPDPHLFAVEEAVLRLCKERGISEPVISELGL